MGRMIAPRDVLPSYIAGLGGYRSPLVGAIGDSRLANRFLNYTVTGTGDAAAYVPNGGPTGGVSSISVMAWLQQLSYGQIRAPAFAVQTFDGSKVIWAASYNQAVGGTKTSALDTQITRLLAVSPLPTHCVILAGTNDISAAVTDNPSAIACLSAMQNNIRAAWARLIAAGIQPITIVDLPRVWSNTYQQKVHQEYRRWQRAAADVYGSWWCDPAWRLADPTSSAGAPVAAYYIVESPLIHPGSQGARLIATDLLAVFASRGLLSGGLVGESRQDAYDATLTPHGNLLPEGGLMISSGGTFSGSPALTGVAPAGWTVRNDNNSASLVGTSALTARASGQGNDTLITITSAPNAVNILLYLTLSNANIAPGDVLSGAMDVNIDASSGLQAVDMQIGEYSVASGSQITPTQAIFGSKFGTVATQGSPPAVAPYGRIGTDPIQMSSSFVSLRYGITFALAAGGSLTARVGAAELRKLFSAV